MSGASMRFLELFLFSFILLVANIARGQDASVSAESPPSEAATSASEAEGKPELGKDGSPSSTRDLPTPTALSPEPQASRIRAVRAIRYAVVVVSILLSMLTTVVLMHVNRWSHGRYAGRLWWMGILLVPAWLLVGGVWAWNNEFWHAWLDGNLL
jgi:hypothetical protein